MDFFETNNYDINDFREAIQFEATRLLHITTQDEALAEKIFALVSDEFLAESVQYQKSQKHYVWDKEIGIMLGIIIYNRLLKESEARHDAN